MAKKYQHSDFDIDFGRNDFINDVSVKYDKNAIRQSIMNIILTRKGEKPFNRSFGVGVHDLLFENMSPIRNAKLERDIINEVRTREPRASVQSVVVNEEDMDKNILELTVNYLIAGGAAANPIAQSLRIELKKVR